MIVYKDKEKKEFLGEYLWYICKSEKSGTYIRKLAGRELEKHESNKIKAQWMFTLFKEEFSAEFPNAKALTSRINLYGSQVYFYFFAEQRYDFADFVRRFREKIRLKFFIYQVGARDRIRLHPNAHERYDSNGLPLMYHIFKHPLEQVNNDTVIQQGLRGRDMERLKDWSWKLDHTLGFEKYIYDEEIPKYPEKWTKITYDGKKMMATGFNILTQEIKLRGEDVEKKWKFTGEYLTISLDEYQNKATVLKLSSKRITKPTSGKREPIPFKKRRK